MSVRRMAASRRVRAAGALVLPLVALVLLAGCATPAVQARSADTIALLLPESKTSRYESVDRPTFEAVVAARCPSCHVLYANADQDAARQQQQAESVLTQGANVLVLDAVDVTAAASIVAAAKARGVAVIAYDRFIADAPVDYYVSFDNRQVGQLQGDALVRALDAETTTGSASALSDRPRGVLVVGGAATDPNSAELKAGLLAAFEGHDIDVLASYDTPDWSPDKALEWVAGQLTQFAGRVDAVAAANDGTAGGAISAMKEAGLNPIPPVTGQDAELAAVQRIISGDQYMTVYKDIGRQASVAAELAVQVDKGQQPTMSTRIAGIPSILLTPVAVTKADVSAVLIEGGIYTTQEICVQPYRRACIEAGLMDGGGS